MNPHVEIPCPQCRHDLRVRAEFLGRRVRCKYCGHAWTPPAEGPESGPAGSRPGGGPSGTAVVGWSWPEAAARSGLGLGAFTRLGDFELLEEVERSGMTTVFRARHLADGRVAKLQVQGRVLAGDSGNGAAEGTIPGYEVLGTVRDGAMGRILKARQLSLDRFVAIKVLRRALAERSEYRERFLREAKIAARLAHHHFIQTIDAGEVDGRPFYVMEFVDGETLEGRLAKHPVMSEGSALTIALGVAGAIRHAHRRGVVHRDIKPENVLLTADGGIKLADLGLARSVDDEEWAAAEAGMAVGTPDYISPEQIRGQVDVDSRSDIYSLGATLYRMVTGRVPFGGKTNREVMNKHLARECPLVPPAQVNPAVSQALSALIQKMMARKRDDRHRLPDDLIHDLCGVLAARPPDPRAPAGPTGGP